jgi:hypothetical protein
MKRYILAIGCGAIVFGLAASFVLVSSNTANVKAQGNRDRALIPVSKFEVEILTDGEPLAKYFARGKTYVEAIPGREYEIRIRNPLSFRVAVALSVDGLNTIDARRTSAWNASKWVLAPNETMLLRGWQMSSIRARRFYFTSEHDSYAAKLGVSSNLGVISAVFFREVLPRSIPVMPSPRSGRDEDRKQSSRADSSSRRTEREEMAGDRQSNVTVFEDEYAATGIGRSIRNDVQWIRMDLERQAAAEVTIRYEYYAGLVKLGIIPNRHLRPNPLSRREQSTGFEDRRFSPEP